jgi:hypothetical protein
MLNRSRDPHRPLWPDSGIPAQPRVELALAGAERGAFQIFSGESVQLACTNSLVKRAAGLHYQSHKACS